MLTPNQLLNVRRIMKEQRARRIAAANKAADRRDAEAMCARERYESTRKADGSRARLPESAVLTEETHGAPLRVLYESGAIA